MKVFKPGDPEPELGSGAIAVVHYGNYRDQEVWVRSGANIGNWYPLWNEFGPRATIAEDSRSYMEKMQSRVYWARPVGTIPQHPTWDDVLARGPVVIVTPGNTATWDAGWRTGRRDLMHEIEQLADWGEPSTPAEVDELSGEGS